MTIAALLLSLIGAPLPVDEPMTLSAGMLSRRIEELDGRTVQVRGWLHCQHWGCSLRTRPWPPAAAVDMVYIGDTEAMAAAFADAAGHQVIVEGRVTAACRREICTDHGPDLMPLRLVRVFGVPGTTAAATGTPKDQ